MTKKIKFLFGTLVLSLGFLFCFCFASLSVNADEVDNTTEEPKVEETQPEVQEETTEETETEFDVNSFLAHLKDLKWEEAEQIIGWIIAYLVVKFGTDAGVGIGLLIIYLKKTKESTWYKNAVVKQNADANKKIEEKLDFYIELLEELKKQNAETLDQYKAKLEELTNDKTKEIEADIETVKAELK